MKNYYLTMAAALLAVSTTVSAQSLTKPFVYSTAEQAPTENAQMKIPAGAKQTKMHFPTAKEVAARHNTAPMGIRRADDGDEEETPTYTIITDQPEGTLHKSWYQYSEGYVAWMGYYIFKSYTDGNAIDWVDGADGNVYVKSLIGNYYSNAWLKATKAEGDTIVFNLPQTIYEQNSYGDLEYFSLWKYNYDEDYGWYMPSDDQTAKFVLRNDSLIFADADEENVMIGLGTAEDGDWCGYGDFLTTIAKFEKATVAPSNPAAAQDYLIKYEASTEDGVDYHQAKVAFEGNDVYLGAINDNQPDAWVKGTLADGKVTFKGGQYMGVDTVTAAHIFFNAAGSETVHEEEYDYDYDSVYVKDEIVFDYDATTKTMKSADMACVTKGILTETLNDQAEYSAPEMSPWAEKAGTPQDPTIYDFMAYDEDYGLGGIQFYLNRLSTDSLYLPAKHLYYKAYLDDEAFTFEPESYKGLTESMTEVPYLFSTDDSDFQYSGDTHLFYFYVSGFDKIGIQEIYNDGTTKLASNIVWQSVEEEEDAVKGVEANNASAKSVRYYDLSGRAVTKISQGLYIKSTVMSDGTVTTKKVMVK